MPLRLSIPKRDLVSLRASAPLEPLPGLAALPQGEFMTAELVVLFVEATRRARFCIASFVAAGRVGDALRCAHYNPANGEVRL